MLKEVEADAKTADLVRRYGVSEATIYNGTARYGALEVSEARRLRELECENAKLKRLGSRQHGDGEFSSNRLHIRDTFAVEVLNAIVTAVMEPGCRTID